MNSQILVRRVQIIIKGEQNINALHAIRNKEYTMAIEQRTVLLKSVLHTTKRRRIENKDGKGLPSTATLAHNALRKQDERTREVDER